MRPHPVRIVVADELRRSRLTVFFRLLLAIPHYIWFVLWSCLAFLAAVANWVATLVTGRSPASLHAFLAAYVRYATHLFAYVYLAARPFPPFLGTPGSYPVDVEIDPPEQQRRWVTLLRLPLAIPALLLYSAVFGGWQSQFNVASAAAFLGWFASLVLGRMPLGFRNAIAYGLRYAAQTSAYLLLLTERYPDSDPTLPASAGDPPPGPIRLVADDELRRSRLTLFFRLLLAIPHIVWLSLWGIVVYVVALVGWLVTLVTGSLPAPLHRFFSAFLRYDIHVNAFLFLVANPFPGFVGRERSYPVDLAIDAPARQHRLVTALRVLLAIPALVVVSCLGFALYVVGFLGWFAALVTGRMPHGLRGLGAWSLRYTAETYGYLLLLTDTYPFSGPPVETPAAVEESGPELEPLAAPAA